MSDMLDEAYGYSDDSPKCGACGKKMLDHLGLRGTCKALMTANKEIEVLLAKIAKMEEDMKGQHPWSALDEY